MQYLITIEPVKQDGDFKGNGIGEHPWTPLQLQKAIAYDLVRIRSAVAEDDFLDLKPLRETLKGMEIWKENAKQEPLHKPEFG